VEIRDRVGALATEGDVTANGDGSTAEPGAGAETPAGAPPTPRDLKRWRRNFESEAASADLYERLAAIEPSDRLAAELTRLGALERAQAELWAEKLPAAERTPPPPPRLRGEILLWLARRFGLRTVVPALAANELRHMAAYLRQPDGSALALAEREVARQAWALTGAIRADRAAVDVGRDHRRQMAGNGSLRAAVFGINDGLVSNLSLVMGVAGAAPPNQFILLTGLAGLLAGAFSMAGGEFISMLSQRELFERQIEIERGHIRLASAAERESLARRYAERGLPPEEAREVATHLLANPEHALDTIVREELGLDPDELGSPRAAALASFITFAVGAFVPLLPFFLATGWTAVIASATLSALALFLVGVGVSIFTGRPVLVSGARMLAIGAGAALLTFLIGRVIGVSVAG
jgi:VIT1/CCC1 family predicted Fe2+/Mn2+ transporter